MPGTTIVRPEFYESFAEEIKSKFHRVQMLVPHRVSSGDYHEEIIRNVLRNFLTKRFSVKKGFVYKNSTEISNQIDLMIIDEAEPAAYLFQENDFAVVLPKAVRTVMEIKTKLDAPAFDLAIENIVSAKKLTENISNSLSHIKGFVFGYDGTKPSDSNLNKWFLRASQEKYNNDFLNTPDAIMFFTAGCLLTRFNEQGSWTYGGKYYHKIYRDSPTNDSSWQLSLMLAIIIVSLEAGEFRRTQILGNSVADRLASLNGASISDSRFSYGEGKTMMPNVTT